MHNYVRGQVKHGQEIASLIKQGAVTSNARTGNMLAMELVTNVVAGNASATSISVQYRRILIRKSDWVYKSISTLVYIFDT